MTKRTAIYYLNESDIAAAKTHHLASELGELAQARGHENIYPDAAALETRYQAVANELRARDAAGPGPHRYTYNLTVWQHKITTAGLNRCSKIIPTRKATTTAADIVTAIESIVASHHRPTTPELPGQTLLISHLAPPQIS